MAIDERVGLIGLGAVGSIYAGHLLAAKGALAVCDLDADKVAAAAAAGATAHASPGALAAASDVIVLALSDPAAVAAVLEGAGGVLSEGRPGMLVIDLSTIDPPSCRRFHAAARARGIGYVEAPISGGEPGGAGTDGARAANVSFMIGGEAADVARARPVLSVLGQRFFHLGPAGAGGAVKLISNHIAGLTNLVCAEAFVLAAAAGIAPETLFEVFDGTDAKSFWMTHYLAPRVRSRDFEPGFTVDLQHKDHRLAGDLGRALEVPLPLNDLALRLYEAMRAAGLGGKDLVEAVNFLGAGAGADIYAPRAPASG